METAKARRTPRSPAPISKDVSLKNDFWACRDVLRKGAGNPISIEKMGAGCPAGFNSRAKGFAIPLGMALYRYLPEMTNGLKRGEAKEKRNRRLNFALREPRKAKDLSLAFLPAL